MEHKNDPIIASLIKEKIQDLEKELKLLYLSLKAFDSDRPAEVTNLTYPDKILNALQNSEQSRDGIVDFILSQEPGNEPEIKAAVSKELSRMVKGGKIKVRKVKGVNVYKI